MNKREQYEEQVAYLIEGHFYGSHNSVPLQNRVDCSRLADQILALIEPQQVCPECGGRKYIPRNNNYQDICSRCHGTGSIPVKWVRLAEDQSMPEYPKEAANSTELLIARACEITQQKAWKAGFRRINKEDLEEIK
jgi:hypothetical protein